MRRTVSGGVAAVGMMALAVAMVVSVGLAVAQEKPAERMDINAATAADIMKVHGIGKKMAARILEYRAQVGKFEHIRDLTQVKGVGEATYAKLVCAFYVVEEGPQACVPYVGKGKKGGKKGLAPGQKVNLNTATASELMQLYGIGQKKAQTIIAYREKNGFFTSVQQLDDIKGFGKKTIERLAPDLEVLVDVNKADANTLWALGFTNADEIIKLRDSVGGFAEIDDLEQVPGIDKAALEKAEDILTFGKRN